MFFGKSRKRKSNIVGTPEYDQYEESDNTQDMLDLQERMRKHGFEGGPGVNKDRWIYNDEIFDIDRPAGGAAQIWSMKEADYNKLKDLLDKLDSEADEYTCDEFANGDKDLADYLRTVLGTGKHTTEDFESALEGYEEEPEATSLSSIAKALTANDLGRSL